MFYYEINFVFDSGSKSFMYSDLDDLFYDLKYDLFEFVKRSRFTTIRKVERA